MHGPTRSGLIPRAQNENQGHKEKTKALRLRRKSHRLVAPVNEPAARELAVLWGHDAAKDDQPTTSSLQHQKKMTPQKPSISRVLRKVKDGRVSKSFTGNACRFPHPRTALSNRLARWRKENRHTENAAPTSIATYEKLKVIIDNNLQSRLFADRISNKKSHKDPALVFFADASGGDDAVNAGCAVVYRRLPESDDWFDVSCGIYGALSVDAESLGVGMAMQMAICEMKRLGCGEPGRGVPPRIFILADCQAPLMWIRQHLEWLKNPSPLKQRRHHPASTQLVSPLISLAEAGVEVEFHWVKGHFDVEGNVRADKLAKQARIWAQGQTHVGDPRQVFEMHLAPSSDEGGSVLQRYGEDVIESLQRVARLAPPTGNHRLQPALQNPPSVEDEPRRNGSDDSIGAKRVDNNLEAAHPIHPPDVPNEVPSRAQRILRSVTERLVKGWSRRRHGPWIKAQNESWTGGSEDCPIDLTGESKEGSTGRSRDDPIDLTGNDTNDVCRNEEGRSLHLPIDLMGSDGKQ